MMIAESFIAKRKKMKRGQIESPSDADFNFQRQITISARSLNQFKIEPISDAHYFK